MRFGVPLTFILEDKDSFKIFELLLLKSLVAFYTTPIPTDCDHDTEAPTPVPTTVASTKPGVDPTDNCDHDPTGTPTSEPTAVPPAFPSLIPTTMPTVSPASSPTASPTVSPSSSPTEVPTRAPTTTEPTAYPSPSVCGNLEPSPDTQPGSKYFTSLQELKDAVAILAISNTHVTKDEQVALDYGYPPNAWDVSRVTSFNSLFSGYEGYDYDLNQWETSQVFDFEKLFHASTFNGNVTYRNGTRNFFATFAATGQGFNIENWDVSSGYTFDTKFRFANFTNDLGNWDMSNSHKIRFMFNNMQGPYTGDLSRWNVSQVVWADYMFAGTPFDGDISKWDVRKLEYASTMFANNIFNQDISGWQLNSLKEAMELFRNTRAFNQNLCPWRKHLPHTPIDWSSGSFLGSGCPQQGNPQYVDGEWVGPFCHVCTD